MSDKSVSWLEKASSEALNTLYKYFWVGSVSKGHFKDYCMVVIWEVAMALLAMSTEYEATHSDEIIERIRTEWNYLKYILPEDEMTGPHTACNPACDDAAWSSMCLMMFYKRLGDEKALELSARTVRRSYDFWKDENTENGLWYRFGEDLSPASYGWSKSVYCSGLILSALEYHIETQGTQREDLKMYDDTISLYNWVEKNLRREDALYYCDLIDNKETKERKPAGSSDPDYIYEAGSCCCLFGATAMAVINALLYQITGVQDYLDKAIKTANALVQTKYNNENVILNDRDAWTNSAFMGHFVLNVLPLTGIEPELHYIIRNTAASIIRHRTAEGYYPPEWSGGCRWTGAEKAHTKRDQLKTNATSVHMITAAHLAETMGM